MTPDELIAAFDVVAEAPDGVARVRELVLQLAVRGKLVAQDPEDEPASVLLERIASEKLRLANAGSLPKQSSLSPESEDETPFLVPESWTWSRFEVVTDTRLGKMLDKAKNRGPLRRYLRNANVQWFRFDVRDVRELRIEDAQIADCSVRTGDLVICEGGEPGRAAVCGTDVDGMVVQKALHRCRPWCGISGWYLAYLLRSEASSTRLAAHFTGATIKHLTGKALARIPVPLPPLPEQRRIVARVDELMGLLDRLDAARTSLDVTRAAVRDSALDALREADTPIEVEIAWNRFAKRIDDLLCDPADIAPLRQTVLQLAVRGRLVPQDPADEPASVLLERVAVETARLVKKGEARTQEPLTLTPENDAPFAVPVSWAWSTLDDLVDPERQVSYGVLVPGPDVPGGIPLVRVAELSVRNPPSRPEKCIGAIVAAQYDRVRLRGDELLVGVVGSIGKIGVARPEWAGAVIARAVARFGVIGLLARDFILVVLQSPVAQSFFRDAARTLAQPTLNVGQLRRLQIPVPPLAEQHRIVARVDELMSLFDRLEARLAAAQTANAEFAAAAVHHLDA